MTIKEQIVDYVRDNPGATSSNMSAALGVPGKAMCAHLAIWWQRGLLSREVVAYGPTNQPRYGYRLTESGQRRPTPSPNVTKRPKAPSPNVTKPIDGLESMLDDMAEKFAQSLADRFATKFRDAVRQKVQAALSAPTSEPEILPPEVLPKKKHQPSVLVCGLLPQQAGMMQREFGQVLDLRFWKDESPSQLKAQAKHVDHVVLFGSKMGHWTSETVESMRDDAVVVYGGMSALRDKLTELYVLTDDK